MPEDQQPKCVAEYVYTDEDGIELLRCKKFVPGLNGKKKSFVQEKSATYRPVLYRLPDVLAAEEIICPEGERDCETLIALGLCATTSAGGAGVKWINKDGEIEEWVKALTDKVVYIVPDNDVPGRQLAENKAQALDGIARAVYILQVPQAYKDITDFLESSDGNLDAFATMVEASRLPENAPTKRMRKLLWKKGEPHAAESEKLIIGGLLDGKLDFRDIGPMITAKDMFIGAHQTLFSVITRLFDAGTAYDVKAVIQELEINDDLENIGGLSYLLDISQDLPGVFDSQKHIEKILDKSEGRVLAQKLATAAESLALGSSTETVKQEVSEHLKASFAISDLPTYAPVDVIGDMDEFLTPVPMGLVCDPLPSLFHDCRGLHGGQLVIIGGRPSTGKSSLGNQICLYSALKYKVNTDIISFEIGKRDILLGLGCKAAKVPLLTAMMGEQTPEQDKRLRGALAALKKAPLRIDDKNTWSVSRIVSYLRRRFNAGDPVRVLMIDYVQLMGESRGRSDGRRDLELSNITSQLKAAAKEFNCTIILLSQLSRASERDNRLPQLSDLKDGSIEADADIVIFTWQNHSKNFTNEREATIKLAKQRNGPINDYEVVFSKPYCLFYEPRGWAGEAEMTEKYAELRG